VNGIFVQKRLKTDRNRAKIFETTFKKNHFENIRHLGFNFFGGMEILLLLTIQNEFTFLNRFRND
jgi:hypothetical protein